MMINDMFKVDVKQTGKQVELCWVPVGELSPHPKNPRIGRPDKVDSIAESMRSDGYRPEKPMLVRPIESGYQIIGGHSRYIAAQEAGIEQVFCAIEAMDDDEAILRMGSDNINDPFPWYSVCLYVVQNSVKDSKKGLSRTQLIRAATGKDGSAAKLEAMRKGDAGEVIQYLREKGFINETLLDPDTNRTLHLAEIHAAPQWLWKSLSRHLVEESLTVPAAHDKADALKKISEPPKWADWDRVADAVISGQMRIQEVSKLQKLVDNANVSGEFRAHLQTAIESESPSLISEVQALVAHWEWQQANDEKIKRDAELVKQRAAEEARQFILNMRKNISLEDWGKLNQSEREEILVPAPGEGGSFNKQESDDIEWAKWSWNPVTGCKHNCSYCYARDIALSKRMEKVYPNGFEPTFRSNALNSPIITKVPAEAVKDARFKNVFTCSMADLFGRWVPKEWIDAVMQSVKGNPQWDFLFLTKFPQRLSEIEIPENAWMGTTVDLQARVSNAEKAFEKVQCRVKWLSVEPMLEPLKFNRLDLFDWVVIGGASPAEGTRDKEGNMQKWNVPYEWIHDLYNQCREAGTKIYMKSNLGVANRVLELPLNLPLVGDPKRPPEEFFYLGK